MSKRVAIGLIVLVIVASVALSLLYWDPLQESSDTVQNVGLVAGGLVAVILGVWRSTIAHRQAEASESDSLDRQFQIASEMLGHADDSVKTAGVIALANLAKNHPVRYVHTVSEILDQHVWARNGIEAAKGMVIPKGNRPGYRGPRDGGVAYRKFYELQDVMERYHQSIRRSWKYRLASRFKRP